MCSQQNNVEVYQKLRKLVNTFWRYEQWNIAVSFFLATCITFGSSKIEHFMIRKAYAKMLNAYNSLLI